MLYDSALVSFLMSRGESNAGFHLPSGDFGDILMRKKDTHFTVYLRQLIYSIENFMCDLIRKVKRFGMLSRQLSQESEWLAILNNTLSYML